MYAGNDRLPITPVLPNKKIFIYDRTLFYKDWESIICNLIERKPSSIIFIHPIICHTLSEYFLVREKDKIAKTNTIILDLNIPLEETKYMLKRYTNLFLADISKSSNVCLPLGGNFKSSFQYFKDFIYKMNLLYYYLH